MERDAETLLAQWAEAFGRDDAEALAALYTPDAMFIGGIGGIRLGPEGVRSYFEANRSKSSITFRDVTVRPHGADVRIVAMIGAIGRDGVSRDFRFIQTHLRTVDGWRIAGHHGSLGL